MSDKKEVFELERYKQWCKAYPEDIFLPLKGDPNKRTEDYDTPEKNNLISRASASMGRYMIDKFAAPLIGEIERLMGDLHGTVTTAYHDELMQQWKNTVVALTQMVETSGGLKCPNCADEGFTAEQDGRGEWYQEQCEFCCTVAESVFNRSRIAELDATPTKICDWCDGTGKIGSGDPSNGLIDCAHCGEGQ